MLGAHVLVPVPFLPELPSTDFTSVGSLVRVNPLVVVEGVGSEEPFWASLQKY